MNVDGQVIETIEQGRSFQSLAARGKKEAEKVAVLVRKRDT